MQSGDLGIVEPWRQNKNVRRLKAKRTENWERTLRESLLPLRYFGKPFVQSHRKVILKVSVLVLMVCDPTRSEISHFWMARMWWRKFDIENFFMIFISGSHVDSIKKIKKICHIHFKYDPVGAQDQHVCLCYKNYNYEPGLPFSTVSPNLLRATIPFYILLSWAFLSVTGLDVSKVLGYNIMCIS